MRRYNFVLTLSLSKMEINNYFHFLDKKIVSVEMSCSSIKFLYFSQVLLANISESKYFQNVVLLNKATLRLFFCPSQCACQVENCKWRPLLLFVPN